MISDLDHTTHGRAPTLASDGATRSAAVARIVERHGRRSSRLVPILQDLQGEFHYLPREALMLVAEKLNIAPARVFGVATFYAHFAIKPKGKHLVRLCDGTACHVKDSTPILTAVRKHLAVDTKHPTTADLRFTVETVACLGACGLAPVVVIDDQVHGAMTPEKTVALLQALVAKEGMP
jgi:NADH-quinone oxidoreductase subunit E